MKVKTYLWITTALLGLILGCNESNFEETDLDLGYAYFPLEIGHSRFFAVDSIIFDPGQFETNIDTLSGLFREDIVDTLRDNAGALLFRIERFYRKDPALPWQIHSVITESRGEREAIVTENNLRLVKLLFPLKTALEWSSTAYFSENTIVEIAGESLVFFKGWESSVLEQRDQFEVEGQAYSDVYLIQLANFENKIEYRYGMEAYAPEIGLIYQEIWVMDTQCEFCCNRDLGACDPLPWTEKAEKGLILKKRLIR